MCASVMDSRMAAEYSSTVLSTVLRKLSAPLSGGISGRLGRNKTRWEWQLQPGRLNVQRLQQAKKFGRVWGTFLVGAEDATEKRLCTLPLTAYNEND
ncbi:hypothetical protein TYRP_015737 [Tyrophagus putrescentiae]|nr:hypothetical protein TYRP_015737 [Tyrophagus putrescentiae]